jgi:hypothetical protein
MKNFSSQSLHSHITLVPEALCEEKSLRDERNERDERDEPLDTSVANPTSTLDYRFRIWISHVIGHL